MKGNETCVIRGPYHVNVLGGGLFRGEVFAFGVEGFALDGDDDDAVCGGRLDWRSEEVRGEEDGGIRPA